MESIKNIYHAFENCHFIDGDCNKRCVYYKHGFQNCEKKMNADVLEILRQAKYADAHDDLFNILKTYYATYSKSTIPGLRAQRMVDILHENKIRTIDQFLKLTEKDFLTMKRVGKKRACTFVEIQTKINER